MPRPPIVKARNLVHRFVVYLVRQYYVRIWGMRIGAGSRISLGARLDKSNPRGVVIGEWTALTFNSVVLTHDFVNRRHLTTTIGSYCFVGAGAVIFPGVTVGDHCIIGVNAVVMRDVPPRSLVMGNPARVIEKGITTIRWGLKPRPGEVLPDGRVWAEPEAAVEA